MLVFILSNSTLASTFLVDDKREEEKTNLSIVCIYLRGVREQTTKTLLNLY